MNERELIENHVRDLTKIRDSLSHLVSRDGHLEYTSALISVSQSVTKLSAVLETTQ